MEGPIIQLRITGILQWKKNFQSYIKSKFSCNLRYRSQKALFDSKSLVLKLGSAERILFEKLETKSDEDIFEYEQSARRYSRKENVYSSHTNQK